MDVMESKETMYRPLMAPSDFADDDSQTSMSDHASLLRKKPAWRQYIPSLNRFLLLFNMMLMTVAIVMVVTWEPTEKQCTRRLSMWSPALEAVEYVDADFADSFNSTSIYRGPPIPEREEAWDKLTYKHGIEVPESELAGLNRSPSDNLKKVPKEVGDGYVGILEVFHQLHCLNEIRMYTWWQVGKYPGTPDGLSMSPLKNRMHVDHCIESLRIALMCWGDVTPLLIRLGGPAGAKADFNTHHRCRNFDKLEDWIDNNWTVK